MSLKRHIFAERYIKFSGKLPKGHKCYMKKGAKMEWISIKEKVKEFLC